MICALSENQQRALRKKVYKDLVTALQTDTPFTVKGYINSVYTQVLNKSNNSDLGLAYAALVPRYIDQLKSIDDDIRRGLRSKGVNTDIDITDNIDKFEDQESGLNNIREYLGLTQDIAQEVRELNQSSEAEAEQQEEKKEVVETKEVKEVTPPPAANFTYQRSEKEFTAVQPTALSDRDQEALEWKNKKSPDYNKPNPAVAFYYKIKRMILNKIFKPEANQSSRNISINALTGTGVYLRLMPITKLDRSKIRAKDLESQERGKPSNWDNNEPVLVLTDEDGSPITLNDNGEFDVNGKPAYYYFRQIYPPQLRNGKVDLYKATGQETVDDYDRADALARQKGISKEEAVEQIRKELQMVYDFRQALKNNPDLVLRSEITGGSFGYPAKDFNINTVIKDIKTDSAFVFQVEPITDPIRGVTEGFTYFTTNETGTRLLQVERPTARSISGMVDKIIDLMFKDILIPQGNKLVPITAQERYDFIQPYFMTRGESLDFIPEENGSYKIKIAGVVVYQSLPTHKKDAAGNRVKIEAFSPEVLAAQKEKAEAAKAILQEYFEKPIPSQKGKASPHPNSVVVSGTDINDPSVSGRLADALRSGKRAYFHNTRLSEKAYFSVDFPKLNVASAFLNTDFKDISIEEREGKSVANITVRSYNRFHIVPRFFINYPINSDGRLTNLNAYFTFEPLQSDLEKVYKKKEPVKETPVESPSTENSDIASNNVKTGLNAAFDDPTLNKRLDQKNAEKKATVEQVAAAKAWYENLKWKDKNGKEVYFKDYFPFEALFNAVNSKNPRALANWTIHGVTLYKGSDYSDLYHEAWHGFTQAFLTKEQKKALYNEVRRKSGSFYDYKGRRVSFRYASDLQIEEYLAEDFRTWMLSGGKAEIKDPVKRSIFQKILDFLSALFGDLTLSQINGDTQALRTIHEMYDKLRIGNLNEYSFSESNVSFDILDKGAVAFNEDAQVKSLSYEDSRFLVDAMDSFMSKFVDDFSKGKRNQITAQNPDAPISYKWTSTLLKKKAGLTYAYQQIKEDFGQVRKGLQQKLEKATEDMEKASLQKQINRLDWALDQFGNTEDISKNIPAKGQSPIGMIAYHMQKSKILEKETKEAFFEDDLLTEEDLFVKGREAHDRGGNESDMKQLAPEEILFMLRSLHKVDVNGQTIFVPGTESIVDGVKVGIPQLEDFDRVWNTFVKILQNSTDPIKMVAKLGSYSKKYPDFPIPQLMGKMGPLGTEGSDEFILWTKFWQTFAKTRVPLLQTTVELTTKEGDTTLSFENWSFKIHSGIASTDTKRIAAEWQNNFATVEDSPYIKPDEGGVNVLDLDKVLKDFPLNSLPGREIYFLRAIGFMLDEDNEDIAKGLKSNKSVAAFHHAINNLSLRRDSSGKRMVKVTHINQLIAKYPKVPLRDESGKIRKHYVMRNFQRVEEEMEVFALKGEWRNFNKTLDLQAQHSDKWGNFMVTNAEGNTQFEHTLNNTLTIMVNAINDVDSYEELISLPWMRHLDVKRNPQAKASLWLNSIFDMSDKNANGSIRGKKREDAEGKVSLVLQNLSGVAMDKNGSFDSDLGIASAKADAVTKLVMDFHQVLLKGAPELTRHADKGTSFSVYLSKIYGAGEKGSTTYVNTLNFLRDIDTESKQNVSKGDRLLFENILLPHIEAELTRIQQMRAMNKMRLEDKASVQNFDFKYLKRGQGFVTFSDVLTIPTKKALIGLDLSNYDNSLQDYLKSSPEGIALSEKIANDVYAYFNRETTRVEAMFKEGKNQAGQPIIADNLIQDIVGQANNIPELKGKYKKETAIGNPEVVRALVKSFVANSWVHNIESIAILYGDLAQYNMAKEEFHKRNAGIGSTGEIYRTDKEAIKYVNKKLGRGYFSKNFPEQPVKQFDGTFDTAIVKDNEIRSVYFKEYAEAMIQNEIKRNPKMSRLDAEKRVLGYDEKSKTVGTMDKPIKGGLAFAYQEMNEGDAQGWITFDSYRILLNLQGKWNDTQEKMYQKIIAGEKVSPADVAMFFPTQKVQYFGPLQTDGLPITAFHKFSLFPLIPSVIQDKRLKDLHDKMAKEGVDYALFQSGSKVGTITKEGKNDKLYLDETDRKLDDQPFTKNTIFLNYLKNQLEIAPKFKEKTVFPTQLRKLVEDGLIEGGVPTDFRPDLDLNKRRKAWKNLGSEQARLEEDAIPTDFRPNLDSDRRRKAWRDQVIEQARLDNSKNYRLYKKYEANVAKLTELKKQELLDEMQWTVVNGKAQGSLENLLKFVRDELTRQDMADHEIDFIDLGRGGKGLKHDLSMSLSAEKIEKMLNAIVTRRLIKQKVNGEGLIQVSGAGFESVSSTGRNYTNPTDADKKKWGTNDLPTYHQKADGTTAAMKVKIAMQGKFKKLLELTDKEGNRIRTIERLNTLLKDEEWLDMHEHRRMVTMVGVRIPVQGLNSMEFMEVYEFLPEEAGNVIIPPAEVVAKSGSDFDIDKLTVMMPSYRTQKDSEGRSTTVMARQLSDKEARVLYEQYKDYRVKAERRKTEISPRTMGTKALEDLAVYDDLMYGIFGISAEELDAEMKEMLLEEGKMQSFEEFFRKLNGTKAVENDLIWNIKEILEQPENFVNLVRPNGTDIVKPLADELASKVIKYNPKQRLSGELSAEDAEELGETPGELAGTRVMEIGYNLYKHSSNNIGKQTLGLGAVDNTYNVIFNRIGAYMNPTGKVKINKGRNILEVRQTLLMPHNTLDIDGMEAISLSHVDAQDGNRISDVISQLINGWVDIAKDAWIFNIQGNKEIAPTLLFMVQAGVPFKTAVYLASQPIVRDYVEAQRHAKSTFGDIMGTAPANINFYRNEARKNILSRAGYGFNLDAKKVSRQDKSYMYNATVDLTTKALAADNNQFKDDKLQAEIDNYTQALENNTTPEYSEYQRAAFMHFLEIEEMAKAVRDIKMRLNFDTSKSDSLFDAQNRTLMLNELRENGRIPENIVDDILEHSVIGSFYIQPFQLEIWKDLFPLRNSPVLNNWLADKMQEGIMDDVNDTFGDAEKFSNELRNDLVSFIFQNTVKSFDIDTLKHYKGEPVEDMSSSKLNEKEMVSSLAIGVFFKNGKAYVDKESLKRQYLNQLYSKDAYSSFGLAKTPSTTFDSQEEYNHFVFEREYLRSVYPTITSLKKNVEYNWLVKTLKSDTKKLEGETDAQFKERTDKLGYEVFLRDKALENIFNTVRLFQGDNTFANKLSMIKMNFPELVNQYSLLRKLAVSTSPLIKGERYTNIEFKDYSSTDTDNLNLYYENILSLMDPTVKKVEDAESNKMISEFFSKLPLVAFLQSGLNTKGKMSLNRILPQDTFIRVMEKPMKEYTAKLNPLMLDVFYKRFVEQNKASRGRLRSRFKNYSISGFSLDQSYSLFKKGAEKYMPTEYSEEARELLETDYRGIETFNAKVINTEMATQLAQNNSDKIFVFNDAFESRQTTGFVGERAFKGIAVSNKIGIPSYRLYSITKSSAIQDVDNQVNPQVKALIDQAIENMKALQQEGKSLVFSTSGYGQEWNGVFLGATPRPDAQIKAPETFLYLSEQLFRNFGYINPGYQVKERGRAVIQEGQEITDQMVRDFMSHCYR